MSNYGGKVISMFEHWVHWLSWYTLYNKCFVLFLLKINSAIILVAEVYYNIEFLNRYELEN